MAQAFFDFCDTVYKTTFDIARHTREGQARETDAATTQLAQTALINMQSLLVAQEQARIYQNDLDVLLGQADAPSNSAKGRAG